MYLITGPIASMLTFLYSMTGNLGWSIILLTIIVRTLLVPLVVPSMKNQVANRKKLSALKPQLSKLKEKHKKDPVALSQAQMALYKENNIKLFSWGILLPFVQIIFLIALYQVLLKVLGVDSSFANNQFYGINLVEKDRTYILIALSVISQIILSVMIMPGIERPDLVPDNAKSKKVQKANEKETDQQEMAETISQQMLFFMPLMTGFFAFTFPAGVVLYWIATTVYSIVQQYFISGWGGLEKYIPMLRRQA
jgi:YidC/Oxa1 family membrane protein insertase